MAALLGGNVNYSISNSLFTFSANPYSNIGILYQIYQNNFCQRYVVDFKLFILECKMNSSLCQDKSPCLPFSAAERAVRICHQSNL